MAAEASNEADPEIVVSRIIEGPRRLVFDVIAGGGTVFLVGGVHLSSAAASQPAPYGLQVSVTGVGALQVNIAGAVTP